MTAEFKKHAAPNVLDDSGRIVFDEVFELTVGLFARRAAHVRPPIHVWEIKKFRNFILGQTKRIALEASRHAKNGVITGRAFNLAALKVMRKTQKFCRLAIKSGRIEGVAPGHFANGVHTGEVCSTYLATQA